MDRMTTDNEKHGLFFLNTFYGKDGQVWVRGAGPAPGYEDCTLVDFLSRAATPLGISLDEEDPEIVGEIMYDNLQFGPMECEGVLGFLWLAAGQATEMRGRLKMIEDILGDNYDLDRLREIVQADRDGRCVVLPCKVGDTVFQVEDGEIYEMEVQSIEIDSGDPNDMSIFTDELTLEKRDFREDVYRTEREAKAALKGEQDGKETE